MCDLESVPFVDISGEYPKAVSDRRVGGDCRGSTADGGQCTAMDLSFESIDEWREHRYKYHPVACSESGCDTLAAYKMDNSPSSYCFEHIPDDPDIVYKWRRTNTKSVAEPPKADGDHPIEAALPKAEVVA